MRSPLAVLCALLMTVAGPLMASEPPAEVAELFAEGVRLMEEGRCEDPDHLDPTLCARARQLFTETYARYPDGLGALRNRAFVERALGLTASAAESFAELAEQAPSQSDPTRREWAEYAREERERLLLVVPRVTILVEAGTAGAALTVDGRAVRAGEAIPLDPGAHLATLRDARGRRELSFELVPGQQLVLTFADTPEARRAEPAADASGGETPPSRRAPRWPGLALVAAGSGTALAGLGMGTSALVLEQRRCDAGVCAEGTIDRARSRARAADVLVSIGAVALAAGGTWLIIVPPQRGTAGGVFVHARF